MDDLSKGRGSKSPVQSTPGTASTPQGGAAGRTPRQQPAPRISLIDVDRPSEPLEVDVQASNTRTLRVLVPNSLVIFELHRHDDESPFEGTLGGRYFSFNPKVLAKQRQSRPPVR